MAHEITDRDTLLVVGQPAWHGLGLVLSDSPTVDEALDVGKLRWRIEQRPLYTSIGGEVVDVPSHVVNVRADTGEILAVVTKGYTPVQNEDVARLILDAAAQGAIPRVESAGSLRAGRDVFFCVRRESFGLGIGGADKQVSYAVFANNHSGQRAFRVYATTVRVVCNNTLVESGVDDLARGFTMRHSAGITAKIEDLRSAIVGVDKRLAVQRSNMEALAARPMTQAELGQFFLSCYASVYGSLDAGEIESAREKRRKAQEIVGAWLLNMDDPKQAVGGLQGTAWAAVNSVTDWLQHQKPRAPKSSDARASSQLFGAVADQSREVFELGLQLVKA